MWLYDNADIDVEVIPSQLSSFKSINIGNLTDFPQKHKNVST